MAFADQLKMVAVDWGSSSLRLAALGDGGQVLAERATAYGIKDTRAGQHQERLSELSACWPGASRVPWVLCGMVGSRNGWREVPYVPVSAGLRELSDAMLLINEGGRHFYFAPGLVTQAPEGADVMRGEETQLLGCMDEIQGRVAVLPGTHSKWVCVDESHRVAAFKTFITGDLYVALKEKTVLGLDMGAASSEGRWSGVSFAQGVAEGFDCRSLYTRLFNVRVRSLFEQSPRYQPAAFLSGLLIGHELRCGLDNFAGKQRKLLLVGSGALVRHYEEAALQLGLDVRLAAENTAFKGCYQLAKHKNVV